MESDIKDLAEKFKGLVPEDIIKKVVARMGKAKAEEFLNREIEKNRMNTWLFLRYALPSFESYACSMAAKVQNLPERTEEDKENALRHIMDGEPLKKPVEELFPDAVKTLRAMANGKPVTEDHIRKYFLEMHRDVAEESPVHKTEEDLINDIVWPAYVKQVLKDRAVVFIPTIGEREVHTILLPDIKEGDHITVHYGYACEKIKLYDYNRLRDMHARRGRPKLRRTEKPL